MKETRIVRLDVTANSPFINVECFDCHVGKRPSRLKHSTTSGERAIQNAWKVIAGHREGHRINLIIGRKP